MVDFPLSESMNSKDARQRGVDGHVFFSVSSRGILVVEFEWNADFFWILFTQMGAELPGGFRSCMLKIRLLGSEASAVGVGISEQKLW